MFGKKDKLLEAAADHRSCRFCGARVPDDIKDDKEVTIWQNTHVYENHYGKLDIFTRTVLKHTIGFGVEPLDPTS